MDLLLDDCLVYRDKCADTVSDKNTLVSTIDCRVDDSHILEVNKSAKSNVLPIDDESQQRFDDIKSQWIELVSEMRDVASASRRLARQVDEISSKERYQQAGESPESGRTPE